MATPATAGSVGFTLSQLGFAISSRFATMLDPIGLDPRQFGLLRSVAEVEGQTQQAIGDRLQIPASTMVALIDGLERRGILERRSDPKDRRIRTLHLAEHGRGVFDEAMAIATAVEATVCAGFDAAERADLVAVLGRVVANLGLAPGVHPAVIGAEPGGSKRPDGVE